MTTEAEAHPTPTRSGPRGRGRAFRAVVATVGVLVSVGVWALLAVHPDGPLFRGDLPSWGSCHVRPDRPAADLTVAGFDVVPAGDVTITGVRPLRPSNIEVAEGLLLPWSDDGEGPLMILAEGWAWPPQVLPEVDYDLTAAEDLVGSVAREGERMAVAVRVRILDPGASASYDGFVIDYRSGPLRYSARVDHDLELPAAGEVCS